MVLRDVAADSAGFVAVGAIVGSDTESDGLVIVGSDAGELSYRVSTASAQLDFTGVVVDIDAVCVAGHAVDRGENVAGCFDRGTLMPKWFVQIAGVASPPTSLSFAVGGSRLRIGGERLTLLDVDNGLSIGAVEYPGFDLTGAVEAPLTLLIARDRARSELIIMEPAGSHYRSGLSHVGSAFAVVGGQLYVGGRSAGSPSENYVVPYEPVGPSCWAGQAAVAAVNPPTATAPLAVDTSTLSLTTVATTSELVGFGSITGCP